MSDPLPDFANPPVVEVALATQFEPLEALSAVQLGLLWHTGFRSRFPVVEEHAPLDPKVERFGLKGPIRADVRVSMSRKPPTPRCWFLKEDGAELVQVQKDWFAHNWRKMGEGEEYPRYEHIRETFEQELRIFSDHLEGESLGLLKPNQCEITYVNHIPAGEAFSNHSELAKVFSLGEPSLTNAFLPTPEELRLSGSFVIPRDDGQPLGRMRFSIEPRYRASDSSPMFLLTLVARGEPTGTGAEGVLGFLDIGREWIVRGFAAITTPAMHGLWGRRA